MKKLLLLATLLTTSYGFSQNIMGAYITTEADNTEDYYAVTVKLDLMMSPWATPPNSVLVNYGDGTSGTLGLDSSSSHVWTTHHKYIANHEYASAGTYTITYHDSARVAGIRNMQNSGNQPLVVKTTLLLPTDMGGSYFGVPLTNREDCFLSGSHQFSYNPGAHHFIDSISYSLGTCSGAGYYLPAGTTLNDASGLLNLTNDTSAVYALNIIIKQWRYFNNPSPWSLIATYQMDFLVGMNGSTSIEQYVAELKNISLYPNPFQHQLQVECVDCDTPPHKITVRNHLGQIVSEINTPSFNAPIDLETLPAGIYLVELEGKSGAKTNSKVVKE